MGARPDHAQWLPGRAQCRPGRGQCRLADRAQERPAPIGVQPNGVVSFLADLPSRPPLYRPMLGLPAESQVMQSTGVRTRSSSSPLASLAASVARNWIVWFVLVTGVWVALPWLAPVFMRLGWDGIARAVYAFYSFQCHQMPQRSFFLLGRETMYGLSTIQSVWRDTIDPLVLRQFVGNAEMGYKVAWSDRMVSAYSSIPLAALVWWGLRKHIRPLSFLGMIALMAPMAIDGATHMLSDLAGIGEGFRYGNEWLARLTMDALPPGFYRGTLFGSFNSWMRLITGVLFGFALIWFTLPRLHLVTAAGEPPMRDE